ncbi:MAG: RNA polymerase sigma factor [Bacteroidota bacterium]
MDSVLVKKAIAGDSGALSQLIDKYKDNAYNLAISIVKDKESAKDITQDSLLKVLENIHLFRNESKFSTWLYRIVYNESLQHILKIKKVNLTDIESAIIERYPDDIQSAENESLNVDLNKAIERLETNERHIILLFYLEEKSIKEINTITGLSKPNIKVILHRARKKLYKHLKLDYEEN